jgi:hypothetical protein
VSTHEHAYIAFYLVIFSSRLFRGQAIHVVSRRMVSVAVDMQPVL